MNVFVLNKYSMDGEYTIGVFKYENEAATHAENRCNVEFELEHDHEIKRVGDNALKIVCSTFDGYKIIEMEVQ